MIVMMILYAILGFVLTCAGVSTPYLAGVVAVVACIDVWSHICAKTGKIK
jgi:hypothetical protein